MCLSVCLSIRRPFFLLGQKSGFAGAELTRWNTKVDEVWTDRKEAGKACKNVCIVVRKFAQEGVQLFVFSLFFWSLLGFSGFFAIGQADLNYGFGLSWLPTAIDYTGQLSRFSKLAGGEPSPLLIISSPLHWVIAGLGIYLSLHRHLNNSGEDWRAAWKKLIPPVGFEPRSKRLMSPKLRLNQLIYQGLGGSIITSNVSAE